MAKVSRRFVFGLLGNSLLFAFAVSCKMFGFKKDSGVKSVDGTYGGYDPYGSPYGGYDPYSCQGTYGSYDPYGSSPYGSSPYGSNSCYDTYGTYGTYGAMHQPDDHHFGSHRQAPPISEPGAWFEKSRSMDS